MAITESSDERGTYLIVECPDGRSFLADAIDRELVEAHIWRIYSRKITPNCCYAYRPNRHGIMLFHREIMDAPKGIQVDHRDWNSLNNRRYNLRLATKKQNNSHIRPGRSRWPTPTISGFRGVYPTGYGRWAVIISIDDKRRLLGTFDDPIEGARVWDAAAKQARGEFTYLNFPD